LRSGQQFSDEEPMDESSDYEGDDFIGMIKIKDGLFISDRVGLRVSKVLKANYLNF
jgi:hypothetical protein